MKLFGSLVLLGAFAASNGVIHTGKTPSCDLIRSMRIAIHHLINADSGITHDLVRFAFHSCVGGCNGCINMNLPANAGLAEALEPLEEKYQKLRLAEQGVSRADFWALAGMVAIEAGSSLSQGAETVHPRFSYQWGRHDCPTSPLTDEEFEFPGGHLTGPQMFSFFKRSFNFDDEETVTILGAHSLGEASGENSGFEGEWTPGQVDVFNTTYYEVMLDPQLVWENTNAGDLGGVPHWQWEAKNPIDGEENFFMLNTDFEIFFDLDLDANGKAACTLDPTCIAAGTCGKHNICPQAQTFDIGYNFIQNPDSFFTSFTTVYTKMLHNGIHRHLEVKGGTIQSCTDPIAPPSCDLVAQMRAELVKLLKVKGSDEQHGALRLAFHSCVGGCHGCLNLDQGDNAGLQDIIAKLEQIYEDLGLAAQGVSRADLWALAGVVAVEIGINLHQGTPINKPCFEYMFGRKDCPTAPFQGAVLEFPAGWMTSPQMFSYFKRVFRFTTEEVVTILGAHSIGMAKKENSGFDGIWTPGEEDVFNVTYYEAMIDPTLPWENVNAGFRNGRQHWQWNAKDPVDGEEYFMLNTDFELFFDLDLDGDGRAVCVLDNTCVARKTCGVNGICAQAATYNQAATYAQSNNAFYADFVTTFTKMIHNGNRGLVVQGGTCNPKCKA